MHAQGRRGDLAVEALIGLVRAPRGQPQDPAVPEAPAIPCAVDALLVVDGEPAAHVGGELQLDGRPVDHDQDPVPGPAMHGLRGRRDRQAVELQAQAAIRRDDDDEARVPSLRAEGGDDLAAILRGQSVTGHARLAGIVGGVLRPGRRWGRAVEPQAQARSATGVPARREGQVRVGAVGRRPERALHADVHRWIRGLPARRGGGWLGAAVDEAHEVGADLRRVRADHEGDAVARSR